MNWRPLLADSALAHAAVADIAAALVPPMELAGRDLASGWAGPALLHHYLDRARPGEGHEARAAACLEAAIAAVSEGGSVGMGLHNGFAGVVWAAEHIGGPTPAAEDDPNDAVDDLLAQPPWTDGHDLMGGLAGVGVYALERAQRASARACLARVVDGLEAPSLTDSAGNAGVAHGVPGVVAVLAAAGARVPLRRAVEWLLATRLPDGSFPYVVGPGVVPAPARTAWCYGDPGVAAALLAAARAVGEPAWEREALAGARRAAARDPDSKDAGLCHGAAGVAHLFNRIHQTTGDAVCADAARRWFAHALALRRPGAAIAGFPSWGPPRSDKDGPPVWTADASFLTGAAGVGLALLAATTDIEPEWDRCLAASLRSR